MEKSIIRMHRSLEREKASEEIYSRSSIGNNLCCSNDSIILYKYK